MFIIDGTSKDPIFEQIKKQIHRFIQLEVLKPDDKLPSVRSLALDLGINPNTVAKAYQELEAEGVVYTLNKKGVFVAKCDTKFVAKQTVLENFSMVLQQCKQNDIEKETLMKMIDTLYEVGDKND